MRKFTPKRAAIEREYKKVQKQIFEERGNYCEGCGRNGLRKPVKESSNLFRPEMNLTSFEK